MSVEKTIKKRLDDLDGGLDGVTFKKETKKGWVCHISTNGLKTATLELDSPSTWTKNETGLIAGTYTRNEILKENFPAELFTETPIVNITAQSISGQYYFINLQKLSASKDYMGEVQTLMLDKDGTGLEQPNTVHFTITAMGF